MPRPACLTAAELNTAYRAGELTPRQVLADVLAVVDEREPELNALSARDDAAALDAARASEQRWRVGKPLSAIDGVPVTVKENLARVGIPMAGGSAASTPTIPTRSSPVVERIEEAGGVIVGSTVMPDWGMLSSGVSSLHGISRSPWNPAWTTGGSSAGAGAAAAGGYGPLHVGTDIGGSIRLPGTWLGLVTLKPSAGRVPLDAPYLGRAAGPLCRTAADAAALLEVIARPDRRDWTALPPQGLDLTFDDHIGVGGLRIGLQLDAGGGMPVNVEVESAVAEAADVFAAAGARVEPVDPFVGPELIAQLDEFWRVRSLVDFEALSPEAQDRVLPFIRRWVDRGRGVSGTTVMSDYSAIMRIQQQTVEATERFDFVLSPVAPVPAYPAEWPMPWGEGDEAMTHIGFTAPYNMSGQPAASVNCGFTAEGKPIGLQVSGRRFDDAGVLRLVDWYEHHRPASATPVWPIPPG